ncbi:hypothetical protein Pyn_37614 [Prunus yedoensis var. nudiflora]|uniref:Uncharacterized protein n=1 Tax=Prunus yedoensis var. nudiflora TaxID=2094558 RepID=A0A314Z6Y4_PRUYE|nr:hypothetical protein Pyn_37613 [Prunus yedoensis var. nudiflora]PQQ12888.1 hypothetical protein Pyn_37614 [Prunus yedoensis var. nudiflora]
MEGKRGSKEDWWRVLGDFCSFRQLDSDSVKASVNLPKQGKQRNRGKDGTKIAGFASERESLLSEGCGLCCVG